MDDRAEPTIRIGIVLPEDRAERVTVVLGNERWHVRGESKDRHPSAGARLEFAAHGELVAAREGDDAAGVSPAWRIEPGGPVELRLLLIHRNRLIQVCDVVAGRGFHWQKPTNVSLPGRLEVTSRAGRLFVVNVLPIEAYLAGVITSEMSGACPIEFLKSQAVVARCWLLARSERKHADLGIDYCNDDCCQRYQGLTDMSDGAARAIEQTYGEVLIHESGVIVDANYSKSCGGIVEAPEPVWGHKKPGQYAVADGPPGGSTDAFFGRCNQALDEYLTGGWLANCDAYCSPNVVPDADLPRYLGRVDDGCGRFRWTVDYTRAELEAILRAKYFDRVGTTAAAPLHTLLDLVPIERGTSGRVTALTLRYRDEGGAARTTTIRDQYWIRHALSRSFLYSSAFVPKIERDGQGLPNRIRLHGAGWGHGAGLCQIGALGMGLLGKPHEEILDHYFERSRRQSVYSIQAVKLEP